MNPPAEPLAPTPITGHGMTVVEPDQAALRAAMEPVDAKYGGIRTTELQEEIWRYT